MLTKIYYNLDETTYKFKTESIEYYFSSLFYMQKFINNYIKNREEQTYKMYSRYNINLNLNDYFDIILYTNIEKRGFKITKDGWEIKCQSQVKLNGEIMTLQNCNV